MNIDERNWRPLSMADTYPERFQDVIGYSFRNLPFLLEALTHSSFAQESAERPRDNEQMEFLGDAVLTFVVSVMLADAFPDWEEGKLTRARAHLVAAPHLHSVASRLNLGQHLRLGRGEEKTGGRDKPALMVNALEAVVAALYRDGGLDAAARLHCPLHRAPGSGRSGRRAVLHRLQIRPAGAFASGENRSRRVSGG